MPQSLANVLLHVVFSTKRREPWIDEAIESQLHAYLATACHSMECPPHKIGSADDHVHLAVSLGRTTTIAALVQHVKQDSSRWFKTKGPAYAEFAWQNGYGAFSIGQSQLDDLRRYIAGQREHHRRESFQEEYRRILQRYGVVLDEHYLWD
ncbi:MAG: IS200/IS605 family transposase [Planctomycetales bacterium]|nr:IS200/IS605 family transposase [Planctomycetales bacterium]